MSTLTHTSPGASSGNVSTKLRVPHPWCVLCTKGGSPPLFPDRLLPDQRASQPSPRPSPRPSLIPAAQRPAARKLLLITLNLLATIQIVWFYLNRVPSFLHLDRYEAGRERMPFQARLLMTLPLRWAHASPTLIRFASTLSATKIWFPLGIRPEAFVEAPIDILAILAAGLVARDLYRRSSPTGLLTPFVYPLTLVMVAASYCLLTIHLFRYVYDLPSLGLFACGMWLIQRRAHPLLFAILFLIATLNRETSVLLLVLFVLTSCIVDGQWRPRRALCARTILTTGSLAALWLAWHLWAAHHFAALPSESKPRLWANLATLLWPFAWPQLAGIAGYTLPLFLLMRRNLPTLELRLWTAILPIWFFVMLFMGLLIEIRLFGELIPLFACACVLLAEQHVLDRAATISSVSQSR